MLSSNLRRCRKEESIEFRKSGIQEFFKKVVGSEKSEYNFED